MLSFLPYNNLSVLGSYRYGPWMDTNLVIPLGPRKCKVVFDYFIEPSLKVIFRFFIISYGILNPCTQYVSTI